MDTCNPLAANPRHKRGRPRHDGDSASEAIKLRQEQNRKAQQTFKARRLATQAETESRISHLEKTTESMTELFLTMTDNVMSFAPVQQDSSLSEQIRDSIVQFLSLVRGSIAGDCERGEPEKLCTDLVVSQTQDSSRHIAVSATACFEQTTAPLDLYSYSMKGGINLGNVERPDLLPSECLDGELSLSPKVFNTLGRSRIDRLSRMGSPLCLIRPHSEFSRSSISIELVRCTLSYGYHVLHDAVDLSTGLVAKIFGLSLQEHTREQLLSKLLWSLGPGSAVLGEFANIDTTGSSPESETGGHTQGFDTASFSNDSPLINAEGVIDWLHSIGVRRIDEEALQIPLWNPATFQDIERVGPRFSQGRYSFLNVDMFFSPTSSKIRKERAGPTSNSTVPTTRISQSALFHHLSKVSVCIDSGLAYHRQHLVNAIIASRVP